MALLEINKDPSEKELRQFAGIWFPLFFVLIGLIIGKRLGIWNIVLPVWVAVAAVALIGLANPRAMRPLFVGWMYAAFPIGWTISHLIIGATYYLLITPIGLLMRAIGRDPMERKIDHKKTTYWSPREKVASRKRYFRQF